MAAAPKLIKMAVIWEKTFHSQFDGPGTAISRGTERVGEQVMCPRWDSEQASTLLLIKAGCDSCKIYDKPGLMAVPSSRSLAPCWSVAPVQYERKGSVAVWHVDCRLLQRYMKDKVVRWRSTSHYPCLSHRTRHHTIQLNSTPELILHKNPSYPTLTLRTNVLIWR